MSFREQIFIMFAKLKFLYDVGGMWFSLITFSLLITSNSEKLLKFIPLTGGNATLILLLASIPAGFLLVIFLGYCMVRVGFYKHYRTEASGKDPVVNETLEVVKRIESKLQGEK